VAIRVLILQQEWPREFMRSTQWSYVSSLGYADALRSCGAQVELLTTPWFEHAPELLAGRSFDQAWLIDLVHLEVDEALWAWLRAHVPMRVGLIGESLRYSDEELREEPRYAAREARVERRLREVTHVLPVDELDAQRLCESGLAARWTPVAMLRDWVLAAERVAPHGPAGFAGSLYAKRVRFFARPELRARVRVLAPADRTPELERRYGALAQLCEQAVAPGARRRELHARYCAELFTVRGEIFRRYLHSYAGLGAAVNPPSLVKTYPGRVVEAIACGVPVVSARVPERPGTERLFEHPGEIRIVDGDDGEGWARALDELAADPALARAQALRARERLLADHTLEARCASALQFIAAQRAGR
jgi:glycosyltransferase involved in cell wall biosynthesis